MIDFKRNKFDVPAEVKSIEYDPNRSAHIALIQYEDGVKSYITAPEGLKVGDTVVAGTDVDIVAGNALPAQNIPVGTMVHNVELYPGNGAQLARSAGNGAQLMALEGPYALFASALRRAAQCALQLHGYHWRGWQCRSCKCEDR